MFGPNEQNAMVLSHRMFERRFNADPSVLGRAVILNGYPVTIVGVLARNYRVAFPAVHGGDLTDAAFKTATMLNGKEVSVVWEGEAHDNKLTFSPQLRYQQP